MLDMVTDSENLSAYKKDALGLLSLNHECYYLILVSFSSNH
ncbi:hypothetical protein NARC_240003 [Candidatus Nitrosocosmicus arcticus]|uniref:Uncharacterized protein n=1 Tax=Candidatus Nitrosocosmicus arcticus TaxID=2035267 RepID=A0A557SQW6_9ARCH|nr:hypothetical protein NARC_240003 [Candidatus Nitrosocosmicus arcticus]